MIARLPCTLVRGSLPIGDRLCAAGEMRTKHTAFYRSGTQGVFIRTAERDEELTVVNLPIKTTLAEATTLHKKLPAGLGEGVVTTARGFAIRCAPNHKADIEQHASRNYGTSHTGKPCSVRRVPEGIVRHFWHPSRAQRKGFVMAMSLVQHFFLPSNP